MGMPKSQQTSHFLGLFVHLSIQEARNSHLKISNFSQEPPKSPLEGNFVGVITCNDTLGIQLPSKKVGTRMCLEG